MGGLNAVALTQDQTLVATVGQEKRATLWDLRDPLPVSQTELSAAALHNDEALTVNGQHTRPSPHNDEVNARGKLKPCVAPSNGKREEVYSRGNFKYR